MFFYSLTFSLCLLSVASIIGASASTDKPMSLDDFPKFKVMLQQNSQFVDSKKAAMLTMRQRKQKQHFEAGQLKKTMAMTMDSTRTLQYDEAFYYSPNYYHDYYDYSYTGFYYAYYYDNFYSFYSYSPNYFYDNNYFYYYSFYYYDTYNTYYNDYFYYSFYYYDDYGYYSYFYALYYYDYGYSYFYSPNYYLYYDYYMYNYIYYRPVTDDDFDAHRIDDDMKESIVPGDAAYYDVGGYVYYQFFGPSSDRTEGCTSGLPSYSTGYKSGTCITDGPTSFMVTFATSNCADLRLQWFGDKQCIDFLYADLLSTFTECRSYLQGSSLNTYIGGCSAGYDLPLARESQVLSYYQDSSSSAASQCDYATSNGPIEFVAYSTDLCYSYAVYYPYSLLVSCTADAYTENQFYNTECTGESTLYDSGDNNVCALTSFTENEAYPFSNPITGSYYFLGGDKAAAKSSKSAAAATGVVKQRSESGRNIVEQQQQQQQQEDKVPPYLRGTNSQAAGTDDFYGGETDDTSYFYYAYSYYNAYSYYYYYNYNYYYYYYGSNDDDAVVQTYSVRTCVRPVISKAPSLYPTSIPGKVPTQGPTKSNLVTFSASQVINGISLSTFTSAFQYTEALTASIAACMEGVTATMVEEPVVTAANVSTTADISAASSAAAHVATENAAIFVSYVVNANVAGQTYSTLTSQLSTSIANGDFNGYLTQYGDTYGAYALAGCTSSSTSLTTTNSGSAGASDDNDDNAKMNSAEIAGVVIAVVVLIAAIIFAVTFFVGNDPLPSSQNSAAKPSSSSAVSLGGKVTTASLMKPSRTDSTDTANPVFAMSDLSKTRSMTDEAL